MDKAPVKYIDSKSARYDDENYLESLSKIIEHTKNGVLE